MAVGLKQSLHLSQQLVMTPQLQQAIKLLQLSRMELENVINSELVENPALEESSDSERQTESLDDTAVPDKAGPAEENPQSGEDFNWESYIENSRNTPSLPVYRGNEDGELPSYESILARPATLADHLLWQLHLSDLNEKQRTLGEAIIGNLNDDGYLQMSVEDIAQQHGTDSNEVEAVLYRIQAMDPVGVASRDLRECLLIQLEELKIDDEIVEKLVENHLGDLEKKNYAAIAKALNIGIPEVVRGVKIIEELEPKPGRGFSSPNAHYIIPDIYVTKRGDEYVVMLNEDGLPKLKISSFYKNLLDAAQSTQDKSAETKEYVQTKLRSALWLIRSIHQRQRTIYRVTESIVRQQVEFFDKGISFLKPMVLRDVANDIGMHESTVSRVTTNKYVHTPRGIFELKFFFNSGIARVHGADVASETVKEKVRSLITAEESRRPLSDQKIVELLLKENINIARRTVAKYREMLGILPSSKRKKGF